jgi:ketosteroid isomerase-like protein
MMSLLLEQRTADFEKVLMSGSLEERMDFYDIESSLSPDGSPVINGKEKIKNFLSKGMKMAKFSTLDLKTGYMNGSREYIYQMGIIESEIIVYDSPRFDNSSKFFHLWKLQNDGSYRISAEVTNTKDEDED